MGGTTLLVRPRGSTAALVPELQRAVRAVDGTVGWVDVQTMESWIAPELRPWALGATMFGVFGVLALLVAGMGLYSVMSYVAAQRTREMGIRMALGASPGRVVGLVMRDGVGTALLGVGLGLVLALAGGRWVASLLFDTSPRDPLVLAGVSAALLAVAILATAFPAWRATRVNPVDALRAD